MLINNKQRHKFNLSSRILKLKYLVFAVVVCLVTGVSFHALAAEQGPGDGGGFDPFEISTTPDIDLRDPMGDKDLPIWCPPANDPGLAVICGTVVTNNVIDLGNSTKVPFVPVDNVLVAAYEENPHSSTGNLEGGLTNIFSSTVTNELGRYRIAVRRVSPPNLKVTLVYFCGGNAAHQYVVDSWHNTWDIFTQIDCNPNTDHSQVTTSSDGSTADTETNTPPFPMKPRPSNSFLGCTNNRTKDTPIGLSKKYEPVINNVIQENNFDHRFTLNTVSVETTIPYFDTFATFNSPGGLWEPDCLLRNIQGTYLCNAPYPTCHVWERPTWEYYRDSVLGQPCSADSGCDVRKHGLSLNYDAVKLYARGDCTNAADPAACAKDVDASKNEHDLVDGVLCNTGPTALNPTSGPEVMPSEDYLTRPFYKYIPKSPGEYEVPFRRFEYRNNMKEFKSDPYAAAQWINSYLGSTSNTGTGFPSTIHFRSFLSANSTTPDVPNCNTLYSSNMPFQDPKAQVMNNSLVNGGFMAGLAEPYSTMEDIYYSGARDLSEYACTLGDGKLVRLCQIQVPWGPGAVCNPYSKNCKDSDLIGRMRQSLVNLTKTSSLIKEPAEIERYKSNIENTIAECNTAYILDKLYFRPDMIFKTGNSQVGFHSDTENDSIPDYCERSSEFEPAKSEQECEALTGSRVALQAGGKAQLDSFGTVDCAVNPQKCANKHEARALDRVIMEPNFGATPLLQEAQVRNRYLNKAIWTVDAVGANQIAMCSISNAYNVDITGPIEEAAGMAAFSADPDIAKKATEIGGFFDNLFTGNEQHHRNWEVGTATWYMSERAVIRDKILKQGAAGFLPQFYSVNPNDNINVGTNKEAADFVFGSLFGRDIWDSMLTLAGGDASIHGLSFHLPEIGYAIMASLAGDNGWKSYAHRNPALSGLTPIQKPYYKVKFDYDLTEKGFKDTFKLPGSPPGGGYVEPKLIPEEWGPGHPCYNFDTQVPPGQFCGTYREPPIGVSRTCRLDKCVAFRRVETARCTCRIATMYDSTGKLVPVPGGNVNCHINDTSREVRNLLIDDCNFENRLMCVHMQETSRAWENWPNGYGYGHYFWDGRSGEETVGPILPPDDIDMIIDNEDHEICTTTDGVKTCIGHDDPSPYIPEHIEETTPSGEPVCFDKYPEHWEDPTEKQYSYTIVGTPGPYRPRCWSSVAGPFRKEPNFSSVQPGGITEGITDPLTGTQNNCNGYIKIEDSALRASQYSPYDRSAQTDLKQQQENLDKSTEIGVIGTRTFSQPYTKPHGGEQLSLVTSQDTNEKPIQIDGAGKFDVLTQNQKVRAQGGVGDRATLRAFFAPPVLVNTTTAGSKLQPLKFHCDMQGTYTPHADPEGRQKEILNVLTTYNPDLHYDEIMGWFCPIKQPPAMPITDLTSPTNSCTVRNWASCTDFVRNMWIDTVSADANIGPSEKVEILADLRSFTFPLYFQQIIDFAGYQTRTPAAALMTIMYLEGGLNPYYYKQWGDNLWVYNKGANWWGQMDLGSNSTCNNLVWTAQGPFKLLQMPVKLILADPIMSDRYCSILARAGRPSAAACRDYVLAAGRCNFLDAAVTTSFLLNPQAGTNGQSCQGFDIASALKLFSKTGYGSEDAGMDLYHACGGN